MFKFVTGTAIAFCVTCLSGSAALGEKIPNWKAPPLFTGPAHADASSRLAPLAATGLPSPLRFVPVAPCRIADTRGNGFGGAFGPPSLVGNVARDFTLTSQCGIPTSAQAVSLNVTVANTSGPGHLTLYPQGTAPPVVSTLNYGAGQTVANAAIAPLGTSGGVSIVSLAGTDLILDSNGYYVPTSQTITVSPVAGDPVASGTALLAAVAAITPSASNPYVLKLEPGTYDLGSSTLGMKPFADIEGSGEGITVVTGANPFSLQARATIETAHDTELRWLTVKNTGSGDPTVAIMNFEGSPRLTWVTAVATGGGGLVTAISNSGGSPVLRHVTATASAGASNTLYGVYSAGASLAIADSSIAASGMSTGATGIQNSGPSFTLEHVTILATAAAGFASIAIYNSGATLILTDVTAAASGGSQNYGMSSSGVYTPNNVTIHRSTIFGTTNSILGGTVRVGASQLDGPASPGSGTLTCVGAYSGAFLPLNAACQ